MAAIAVASKMRHPPRPYQEDAITAACNDLAAKNAALVVVPTGGGKTVIIGHVADRELAAMPEARFLFLQHTDELLHQNFETVSTIVSPQGPTVSIVKARLDDWEGQLIFASTPTLSRPKRRENLPFITHLIVDEAHRLGTAGCKKIIAALRAINPDLKILGVTATPNRADGQTLEWAIGEGVSYQITYAELIDLGVLVEPRTFTIDLGLNAAIEALPMAHGDFDFETIGSMMNREVHNDAVFEHWLARAGDRQTIGFCPTVRHALDLAALFRERGIVAEAIYGEMDSDYRSEILERYEAGTVQVVFNCMVLIEGYDAPRTSCIILLRPMVEQITFLQSVGRGLRGLDPAVFPHESKIDCILLDFTGAAARHGTLELLVQSEREALLRSRTEPKAKLDNVVDMRPPKKKVRDFTMREIELLSAPDQPLVFGNQGFEHAVAHNNYAWAGVFNHEGVWHAVAQSHDEPVKYLGTGDRLIVVGMVDRFLRRDPSGRMPKTIREAPLTKQQKLHLVRQQINPMGIASNYDAQCRLSVAKAQSQIRELIIQNQPFAIRQVA